MLWNVWKLEVYTDLEELNGILGHTELDIHYFEDIEKVIDEVDREKVDVLITDTSKINKIERFKGRIILKDIENEQDTVLLKADSIILSRWNFLNALMSVLELLYRQKRLKRENIIAINQLGEAMRQTSEFNSRVKAVEKDEENRIAMLNHELKTPLNIIFGNIELIKKTNLSESQESYMKRIEKAGRVLKENLEEILFYEEIMKKQEGLDSLEFNLKDMLNEMNMFFNLVAKEKNLRYEFNYDKELFVVYKGDNRKLEMILKQILSNSFKFTNSGFVRFEIDLIQSKLKTHQISFKISDSGIGFERSKLEKLMEPFKQDEDYINRTYGGLGLGLTIVKAMINILGGILKVDTKPGMGSIFEVILDLEAVSFDSSQINRRISILFVEDSPLNRKVMKQLLEGEGLQVVAARNGKEALEIFEEKEFDLILTDLVMPVMDGYVLSKEIRKIDKNIPIIVASASSDKKEIDRLKEVGVSDFIDKKQDIKTYMDFIRQYVNIGDYSEAPKEDIVILKKEDIEKRKGSIKIDIQDFIERYNHRYILMIKLIDGIQEQLNEIQENWDRLKTDIHDEESKRFFHSLKGLVRSASGVELGNMLEKIEKAYGISDFTDSNYQSLINLVQIFKKDILEIKFILEEHIKNEKTDIEVISDGEDILKELEILVDMLEKHDVKSIRSTMDKIMNIAVQSKCEKKLEELKKLIDSYQYEEATEWIKNILEEKKGEALCSK